VRRPNRAHVTLGPNLSGTKNPRFLLPLPEPDTKNEKSIEDEVAIARGEVEERLWLSTFLYALQFIARLDTAPGVPQNRILDFPQWFFVSPGVPLQCQVSPGMKVARLWHQKTCARFPKFPPLTPPPASMIYPG
jgi:hypothetical protein